MLLHLFRNFKHEVTTVELRSRKNICMHLVYVLKKVFKREGELTRTKLRKNAGVRRHEKATALFGRHYLHIAPVREPKE